MDKSWKLALAVIQAAREVSKVYSLSGPTIGTLDLELRLWDAHQAAPVNTTVEDMSGAFKGIKSLDHGEGPTPKHSPQCFVNTRIGGTCNCGGSWLWMLQSPPKTCDTCGTVMTMVKDTPIDHHWECDKCEGPKTCEGCKWGATHTNPPPQAWVDLATWQCTTCDRLPKTDNWEGM